jgi:AcrR family transcriptional regulator
MGVNLAQMFSGVNMYSVRTSARATYHHGDLRNALVSAAADLAERGGPEAVTVRAAARAVGVTPTAAYRHFAGHAELLDAAKQEALDRMASTILELLGDAPAGADPVDAAVHQMRAGGRGYVRFALTQPGLFRTAFCRSGDDDGPHATEGPATAAPFVYLIAALDELVRVGWLDPALRPGAETPAWAGVHGLSLLLLDGPYRGLDDAEREIHIDATLDNTLRGLATGPAARGRYNRLE